MLERGVAIGLNANQWWYLALFVQVHSTHRMGKCITPPLKKCFHHCSGITIKVILLFDQDCTRYLTQAEGCRSVMWKDLSRNACIYCMIICCSCFWISIWCHLKKIILVEEDWSTVSFLGNIFAVLSLFCGPSWVREEACAGPLWMCVLPGLTTSISVVDFYSIARWCG